MWGLGGRTRAQASFYPHSGVPPHRPHPRSATSVVSKALQMIPIVAKAGRKEQGRLPHTFQNQHALSVNRCPAPRARSAALLRPVHQQWLAAAAHLVCRNTDPSTAHAILLPANSFLTCLCRPSRSLGTLLRICMRRRHPD